MKTEALKYVCTMGCQKGDQIQLGELTLESSENGVLLKKGEHICARLGDTHEMGTDFFCYKKAEKK